MHCTKISHKTLCPHTLRPTKLSLLLIHLGSVQNFRRGQGTYEYAAIQWMRAEVYQRWRKTCLSEKTCPEYTSSESCGHPSLKMRTRSTDHHLQQWNTTCSNKRNARESDEGGGHSDSKRQMSAVTRPSRNRSQLDNERQTLALRRKDAETTCGQGLNVGGAGGI